MRARVLAARPIAHRWSAMPGVVFVPASRQVMPACGRTARLEVPLVVRLVNFARGVMMAQVLAVRPTALSA